MELGWHVEPGRQVSERTLGKIFTAGASLRCFPRWDAYGRSYSMLSRVGSSVRLTVHHNRQAFIGTEDESA